MYFKNILLGWLPRILNTGWFFFLTARAWDLFKGEQGTAELGANTVLKQTNELCF